MDDNAKQVSSFQLDQEVLDARGIDMTVEEVAGLPTCKYSERVHSLHLNEKDLAFLKGLRRRIKNRLASQNSRRRSMEHLRRLTRELRAVRACRSDALAERRTLVQQRDVARERCQRLRSYVALVLKQRSDPTEVPSIEIERITPPESHDQSKDSSSDEDTKPPLLSDEETKPPLLSDEETKPPLLQEYLTKPVEKNLFECRLEKLVQKSVNHIYKDNKKYVYAKTVFLDAKCENQTNLGGSEKAGGMEDCGGVLNLSVKDKRRSHGRKQLAPRRITYACVGNDDGVLDLKIKKEP